MSEDASALHLPLAKVTNFTVNLINDPRFRIENLMESTAEYFCAFCGEANTTFIDFSAGTQQSYIEDCQVCCRPNILYIRVDEDTLDVEIDTDYQE